MIYYLGGFQMADFNFSEYKEIQKAMEINSSIQEMYKMFLSIMGISIENNNLVTGTSNVILTNANASTRVSI